MEYAQNGDLLKKIENNKIPKDEETVKFIFREIVKGIRHCHQKNIIHRDIKVNNILLDQDLTVKICDFGISRVVTKGEILKDQCGTPAYMSPEMILKSGN